MVYAFTGSHRSGKTTLAKAVAEDLGIEFYETKTADVMAALGIDIVSALSLADRLGAQELLLNHHLKMLADLPRPLIVDRCPIDFFAYTIAEIGMHSGMNAELDARMTRYLNRCLFEMERNYAVAIVCAPLPHYKIEKNKPAPVRSYQQHFHHIVEGAVYGLDWITHVSLPAMPLEQRRQVANEVIVEAMKELEQERAAQRPN
jgi:predicted ATPase